ncbi:MAG: hypothetical protein PUP92_26880 [Rhizonema sp. PD38]|nr:hypothetical protein [Rhizonema sp. PD38]
MKRLILALFVLSCALTVTQKADANIINVSDSETDPASRAAVLETQPVMISSTTGDTINQTNRLKEVANSIGAVHNQPFSSVNPLDFFKNPSASLKQFSQENQNQPPQQIDPLGISKVLPLDSENIGSFNVPVIQF